MGDRYDPRSMSSPMGEIIPPNEETIKINDALKEIQPAVVALSDDISGIGKKAAQRYILRYEYGISTGKLANEFNITPQTISNQVSGVRAKILKYPRLAHIIGTLRAHRTDLSVPDIDDGHTWTGERTLHGESVEYSCEFQKGSASRPYSWAYLCESRYERDSTVYHLFLDYIIDAIHGVFLKRQTIGVSKKSWERPPIVDKYDYIAYPLPNLEVPNERSGSLLDAVEYHWAWDTKNMLESRIQNEFETELDEYAETGDVPWERPYLARDDVLSHKIRNCRESKEAIKDYREAVFVRNNLERLCLTYPFKNPYDLEYETITHLWNGQPAESDNYNRTSRFDKADMYGLTNSMTSRYQGRDVRVPNKRGSVDMPAWDQSSTGK